jgi:hypothetical protein
VVENARVLDHLAVPGEEVRDKKKPINHRDGEDGIDDEARDDPRQPRAVARRRIDWYADLNLTKNAV